MAYQYLENVTLQKAITDFVSAALSECGRVGTEIIPVDVEAFGRVNAAMIVAKNNAPHYNACAMDGVAVKAAATFGATDTTPVKLSPSGYIPVDTGDVLPEDCDAVIMIEDVVKEDDSGDILLYTAAAPWQHVRQIGEDVCIGEMILPANTVITESSIGAMLAAGVHAAEVYRRVRVGVIPTGDEIVSPKESPEAGEIINFNTPVFSAMIKKWGGEPTPYPVVPDKFDLIKAALKKAADENDIVVINAGSSAGRDDYSSDAIAELGRVIHHGVSIRPGKPAIMGIIGKKPVLGVPGYPVSGIVVLRELLRPVIAALCGMSAYAEEAVEATLTRSIVSSLKYEEFIRMKVGKVGGKLVATPLSRGAGVITSFVKADGMLTLPLNSEGAEAGDKVSVKLLRPRSEIENTLCIIGSHDPLIDHISNIMRLHFAESFVASSHVGSMGGIMAIKRGEAHLAGIHLLDEEDGSYNVSYLRQHFPDGGVALIKGVKRIQGLMVAAHNPLAITGIADLKRDGLRYVNRQRGAGTRLLLDYLLKKEAIVPTSIYGYTREEPTHIAVATQIAAGTADCGMGIYSASQSLGLGFLPIGDEEYDFLIRERDLDTALIKKFLDILRGTEFAAACEIMGGYGTDGVGRVLCGGEIYN